MTIKNTLLAIFCISIAANATAGDQKIGSSLHKKEEVSIDSIPQGVLSAVKALAPNMTIKEAEKEYKNGNTYIDVEGELENGSEIEFDLLKTGDDWKVVEIQRDLQEDQLPENVLAALKADSPNFKAKRIIESIQHGEDLTVYEFYGVKEDGTEVKKEVKLESGDATILKKEWTH